MEAIILAVSVAVAVVALERIYKRTTGRNSCLKIWKKSLQAKQQTSSEENTFKPKRRLQNWQLSEGGLAPKLEETPLDKRINTSGQKIRSMPDRKFLTREEKKQAINAWKLAENKKPLESSISEPDTRTEWQKELDDLSYRFGKKTAIEKMQRGRAGGTARPASSNSQIIHGPKSGWVYVIRDNSTGLYKIGRTKHIDQRMRQLGVGKTATLIQKKQVSDSYAVEKAAHRRYKNSRLPQTEYFKLNSPPTI